MEKKAVRLIKYCIEFFKYYALWPAAFLACRNRPIYLISERGYDARDNGYHFFSYLRKNHPEINAYYVVRKDSADYKKIKDLGNIVFQNTLKHYLLFIAADYKISTHIFGYSTYPVLYARIPSAFKFHGKKVFLQHGVTKNDLPQLYAENTKLDLFICGAEPEYEYIKNTFHYKEGQVKYTGFARYDNLHDNDVKNQILVMPTWRMYLADKTKEYLKDSEYVSAWKGVLNNKSLSAALKKHNIKLIFYPHIEMQKYIELFNTDSDNIVIADFDHYDVQQLLKESRLLVTDFSSVYFDFAYMKKPVIYYQFDQQEYHAGHYKQGYFDYYSMGFGEVTVNENDLIGCLIEYIENGCQMKEKYLKRTDGFFTLHDTNNCERIYNAIREIRQAPKSRAVSL